MDPLRLNAPGQDWFWTDPSFGGTSGSYAEDYLPYVVDMRHGQDVGRGEYPRNILDPSLERSIMEVPDWDPDLENYRIGSRSSTAADLPVPEAFLRHIARMRTGRSIPSMRSEIAESQYFHPRWFRNPEEMIQTFVRNVLPSPNLRKIMSYAPNALKAVPPEFRQEVARRLRAGSVGPVRAPVNFEGLVGTGKPSLAEPPGLAGGSSVANPDQMLADMMMYGPHGLRGMPDPNTDAMRLMAGETLGGLATPGERADWLANVNWQTRPEELAKRAVEYFRTGDPLEKWTYRDAEEFNQNVPPAFRDRVMNEVRRQQAIEKAGGLMPASPMDLENARRKGASFTVDQEIQAWNDAKQSRGASPALQKFFNMLRLAWESTPGQGHGVEERVESAPEEQTKSFLSRSGKAGVFEPLSRVYDPSELPRPTIGTPGRMYGTGASNTPEEPYLGPGGPVYSKGMGRVRGFGKGLMAAYLLHTLMKHLPQGFTDALTAEDRYLGQPMAEGALARLPKAFSYVSALDKAMAGMVDKGFGAVDDFLGKTFTPTPPRKGSTLEMNEGMLR